uniref:Secreted protein n=1 Tax=Agrobacterium albertimagni TaxID=147266 RepID=A0A7C1SZY1_9HYPH
MKRILIAAAALILAACQPVPTTTPTQTASTDTPAVQTPAPGTDAAACAARGGKMLPQGRLQSLQCVVSYADAGRRCTDGDDCQGDCRIEEVNGAPDAGAAAVGQCQASSSRFGCYTTVEGGKAEATICVD